MFNYNQALNLYLSDLRTNDMSDKTLATYKNILGYYAAHCAAESLDMTTPAAVASYKARMSERGNKLVTISMHLNIVKLFFDFDARMKLYQGTNPVLPELMPPRKKVRAERKPYDHLMGESEMQALFLGNRPAGVHLANWLRNRAIVLTLLGCGLRNTELRMLTLNDLTFGRDDEANITVRSGKGDKFRIVPFPALTQQAVKAYLESGERPSDLSGDDILFGIGKTRDEWRMMTDENLSVLCKRYIKSATGFDNARSHACRHAFASFNLTHGVPMAEIQSMLGHSSITTTEHYAALLRPTAPTSSGNKVFNDMFSNLCEA
ncbi:MAG: tyrosine-type recombinase/integrase [Acidaminococcaceae bacterium]|nr:tyrosine-type recombinase/integrase [Acidaminococcaceae bacterium]